MKLRVCRVCTNLWHKHIIRYHIGSTTNLPPQTLSDSIAEVARLFSLQIAATNLAGVDVNSSRVDVIVTASDNPHGIVQFAPPLVREIQETQVVLLLPIQRTLGLVGTLTVSFSVTQTSATTPEDFIVLNQSEGFSYTQPVI